MGKHTDYAGGRSLLAAISKAFCVVTTARDDALCHFHSTQDGCDDVMLDMADKAKIVGKVRSEPCNQSYVLVHMHSTDLHWLHTFVIMSRGLRPGCRGEDSAVGELPTDISRAPLHKLSRPEGCQRRDRL